MAASMVLTPHPELAAIYVSINTDGRTLTELRRYDANGSAAVRVDAGLFPTTNPPVIVDYEPAISNVTTTPWGNTVRYTAIFASGPSITSSWTGWYTGPRPWLSVPLWPEKSVQVELITGYDAGRTSGSIFHEIIDRVDPAVTLAPLRTRAGMFEVWCADYPTAAAVVAVHDLAQVCMLRQPDHPGLDMYYAVDGSVSTATYSTDRPLRWAVRVPYREVSRPSGDLIANAGWTFDAVAEEFDTFAEVRSTFATFADLATNTRLP